MIRLLSGLSILFLSVSAASPQDSSEKIKRNDTIKAYKDGIKTQQLYAKAWLRIFDKKDSLRYEQKLDTLYTDSIKRVKLDTGKIK